MGFLTICCQNIGLSIGSPNISVYYFGTSKYFEQISVWLHPFNLFINHLVPHLDRLQAIMFTNVCKFSLSSQEYFPLICCLSEFPPPSFEMFEMGNNFQQDDDHLFIFLICTSRLLSKCTLAPCVRQYRTNAIYQRVHSLMICYFFTNQS